MIAGGFTHQLIKKIYGARTGAMASLMDAINELEEGQTTWRCRETVEKTSAALQAQMEDAPVVKLITILTDIP